MRRCVSARRKRATGAAPVSVPTTSGGAAAPRVEEAPHLGQPVDRARLVLVIGRRRRPAEETALLLDAELPIARDIEEGADRRARHLPPHGGVAPAVGRDR